MKKVIQGALVISSLLFGGDFTNSIGMTFKEIASGSFVMGTPTPNCPKDNPFTGKDENANCMRDVSENETPAHKVEVASFYMAETEVTQGQWYEIMGNNPAKFKTGNPNMPVERVSWHDIQKFIKQLNIKEKTNKYRLPTEEEWEYVARAGTTTKWSCGDNISCLNSVAVYNTNNPKLVKSKKPNPWGLYDMHGNVYEWTNSWYSDKYNQTPEREYKVIRGGSWGYSANNSRSANRYGVSPTSEYNGLGFRLSRVFP